MQKIKVVTVATRETPELKALIRSAKSNGMDLTVLGLGTEWKGFGTKIILTIDYLQTLDGYTHFIFVDAYDTLFLKPIKELPNKIFFSAEKACYPDWGKMDIYPPHNSQWKYLNSGTYSAPIKEYLGLINSIPLTYNLDDQRFFTDIFLKGGIELDYNCDLFQSFAFSADTDFTITDTITNNLTNTQPSIIHFNGKCLDKKIYNMVEFKTLDEVKNYWQDSEQNAKEINEAFIEKVNNNQKLHQHRTFIENHVFGFGERSFPYMWNLLIKEMPKYFTFLEIGVFKGQTLSLVKLLADQHKKKIKRYGVTPLSTEGGLWESDYAKDIETIHDEFKLTKDYEILQGLSEDATIIEKAQNLQLDILYIDGGHDERHITNDIENYAHLVKKGGYMVIDDCCNSFKQPFGYFQGIDIVTKVVDRYLPPFTENEKWEFVFSVVHNRVYKRVK
jgi:hypothetical protein